MAADDRRPAARREPPATDRNDGSATAFLTTIGWRAFAGVAIALVLVLAVLGVVGLVERWPVWAGIGLGVLLLIGLIGRASRRGDGDAARRPGDAPR
jgi:hypothetical protein